MGMPSQFGHQQTPMSPPNANYSNVISMDSTSGRGTPYTPAQSQRFNSPITPYSSNVNSNINNNNNFNNSSVKYDNNASPNNSTGSPNRLMSAKKPCKSLVVSI